MEEDNNQRTENLAEEDNNQWTENVSEEENNQRTENLVVQESSQEENSREEVVCQATIKKYSRKGRKERTDCRQTGKAYTTVSGISSLKKTNKSVPSTNLGSVSSRRRYLESLIAPKKPSLTSIRDDGGQDIRGRDATYE